MITKLKQLLLKNTGQALVEYAMLLALTTLTITAFLNMNDQMKVKIQTVASDFETDMILLPEPEPPVKPDRDMELSPPVAQFNAPSPNYKGREILFTDSSYDVDGYVEHWRWTIDGKPMNRSKAEIERDGGLKHSFRYSGSYNVSLYVFDNDGLVSNIVNQQVTVINRDPTVTVVAQNQMGVTGTSITVPQMCFATFLTTYTDPDLPYDELKLFSRFIDHTGVASTDDSAPHQFTRQFVNLGTNTYTVTVTDEEGRSASATATVTVVPNPSGTCDGTPAKKPVYKIEVFDAKGIKKTPEFANVYTFNEGDQAFLYGRVTWGTFQAHSIPYHFNSVQNSQTLVNKWQETDLLKQPLVVTFKRGDKPITVTGMARDMSASSDTPDPNLNGMSNKDTVILTVNNTAPLLDKPIAVISYNGGKDPSSSDSNAKPNVPITTIDLSKEKNKYVEIDVESHLSKAFTGATNTNNAKIKGVRWKLPNGTWRPNANEANTIYDSESKKYYYKDTPKSPDSKVKLTWVKDKENTWVYELEVVNNLGMTAKTTKTFVLKNGDGNDKPPVPVCTPNPYEGHHGDALKITAAKSTDDKGTVQVRWSLDNFVESGSGWQAPTAYPPDNEKWRSLTIGTHTIWLEAKDNANQTAKIECKVIIKKVEDVANNIRPELNYIEHRVRFASNQPVPFRNTTNSPTFGSNFKLKDIHYTAWTNDLYTSDVTTFETQVTNHVGASNGNSLGDNAHTKNSLDLITTNHPGAYKIYIWASDKDGVVKTAQCKDGDVEKKTINGETIDMCGKGTFYFRFGKQVAGGGVENYSVSNESGLGISSWGSHHRNWPSLACHKISKSMSTYGQYQQAYQGGGAWDQHGEVYVDERIKIMLRKC